MDLCRAQPALTPARMRRGRSPGQLRPHHTVASVRRVAIIEGAAGIACLPGPRAHTQAPESSSALQIALRS